MTSGYFTLKSVFGQQGYHALTFALAGLSCTFCAVIFMLMFCRKLLVECLIWSRGCGENHIKNTLKSRDEKCFILQSCGSRMIGLAGSGEIMNNSHLVLRLSS